MNFEKMYLTKEPPLNRILVLEDLDFVWDESELKDVRKMWNQELTVYYMADYFNRDPDELVLATLHLAREGKIGKRKSGLLDGIIGVFDKKKRKEKEGKI